MGKKVLDKYGDKLLRLVPDDIDVNERFGIEVSKEERLTLTWQDLVEWQDIQSASRGAPKSIQSVTDRAFGKVTQVVENHNLNISYTEFLDQLPSPPEEGAIKILPSNPDPEDLLSEFL